MITVIFKGYDWNPSSYARISEQDEVRKLINDCCVYGATQSSGIFPTQESVLTRIDIERLEKEVGDAYDLTYCLDNNYHNNYIIVRKNEI